MIAGLGLPIGVGFGIVASRLGRKLDDPMIDMTLTTIAAYGSFSLAEGLHGSGVIATVAAGVTYGTLAAHTTSVVKLAVPSFWEYVAFALNSIVFLLIGFQVHVGALLASWKPILVAYLVMAVARATIVFAGAMVLSRTPERLPRAGAPCSPRALEGGSLHGPGPRSSQCLSRS